MAVVVSPCDCMSESVSLYVLVRVTVVVSPCDCMSESM